jgi:ribosomal protein L37AE/L43A
MKTLTNKEKKQYHDFVWKDDKQKIIKRISDAIYNCQDISKVIKGLYLVEEQTTN